MKYYITATMTTDNDNMTTAAATITATDAKQAHDTAAALYPTAAAIRVYPSTDTAAGLARGALMITRRTAVNAVMRTGGNPTQSRIERETAAVNARCHGAETAERIISVVADYSQDTQEFFATAAAALACATAQGMEIPAQYAAAYKELNASIQAQRAATEYEISTEFLTDGGGDLIAINTAISAIIRGGDKWTAANGGEMDAETAERLGNAISVALRRVTPTQRRIAELLARGYSQRRIAEMTGRELATINRNIAVLRGKVAESLQGGEFAEMVKQAQAAAAAKAAANGGRTAAGMERKAAQDKATQAERARRYRERKAAERKAAQDKTE